MAFTHQRTTGGALLRTDNGSIAGECCCGGVVPACSCDTGSADYSYTVTFAGLGGAFAVMNGAHTITYGLRGIACQWDSATGFPRAELYQLSGEWKVRIWINQDVAPGCYFSWRANNTDWCDPTTGGSGPYTAQFCNTTGCGDVGPPGSCALSVGATCVIS